MQFKKFASTCFILFLVLVSKQGFSQNQQVSAVVVDSKTGDPLGGANVYLKDTTIGTVTDADGFFKLIVPATARNDSLIITYLGYATYRLPLFELTSRTVIKLQPLILESDKGITVYADKLDLVRKELPHTATVLNLEEI
jgi:hypothetical protein